MRQRALDKTRYGGQGGLIPPPNSVSIPAATIVTIQIATGLIELGGVTVVDANMFRATSQFQLAGQGYARATFNMQGTLDPSNANNMQTLIELGLDDMDVAGNGTVISTFITESQILGGANSDLVAFTLYSWFRFLVAPETYRLRVRCLVTGVAVVFQPVTLRSSLEPQ
jgi:hypothetical protein